MASIIKLKRNNTQGAAPGSLETGEIAVNLFDRKLYVGNGTGVSAIGGEDFRLTVDEGSVNGDGAYIKLLGETSDSTNSIFLQAGTGMDVTMQSNGSITFGGSDATTSAKGIASFAAADFAVTSGAVAVKAGGIARAQIADGAINGAKVGANSLGANTFVAKAVGTAAIADGAVGATQIGAKGIQANNIADGIITPAMVGANALTANTLAAKAVGTVAIADAAITAAKVGANALTANTYGAKSVETAAIADAAITAAKVGANALTANTYGVKSVGTAAIADAAIGSPQIAAKGIQANNIADGIITAPMISPNALTANTYGAKSVETAAIADGAITPVQIGNQSLTANVYADDSIALGTKTTGNYVATVAASNSSLTITGSGSETAGVTVAIADNIGANTSGNAATSSKLATARAIALTGDVVGTVNFDGSAGVSMTTAIQPNSVALGTDTTGNFMRDVSGTANEIVVTHTPGEASTATLGLADSVTVQNLTTGANIVATGNTSVGANLTVSGDAHVDGNLTVEGAVTYISSSTVNVDDSMLKLSANNAADTVDTGVYGKYVVSGNSAVQYTGYFRDATTGHFNFYTGLDVEPTTTVDISDSGYTLAQLNAIIDGGSY